jgi:hypothetical protein
MKTLALTLLILSLSVPAHATTPYDTLADWQRAGTDRHFYLGAVVGATYVLKMLMTCTYPVSGSMVVAVLDTRAAEWAQTDFYLSIGAALQTLGCTFTAPEATAKAQRAY